ncbi:ATP-dependent RNA helicase DbpA-like [Pollicipes pollicipes]|uniref:ATP-dependent RNA helicase DbpA-like n=1 Tax=Pollicipes pollicipes TaxID=41117 RepID=UPI00188569E5|nr:ATP-dependent RNA helicase DbpA-like [Pollicipes pollicipes]
MSVTMNERDICQLFERLQTCVDQMRVMQNLQEKEHHNLYRSILKLDKQVSYLVAKKGTAPGKRRGGDVKKPRHVTAGDEVEDEKRPSTGEELSSNETDSSHAEPGEHSPRPKKNRRSERRSRRHRRAKRASEGRAPPAELQLKPDLMTGIQASPSGASEPTPFQQAVLPALLQEHDVVVQVNPQQRACQALVLTSSREAAKQMHRELVGLATFIRPRLTCHLSIGGTSIRDDLRDMSAGCHLVVGTLGRAFDMLRRGALKAADLRIIVLDDVDTMMTRRFDKDHIYAVLGDVTSDVQEQMQVMLFLSMMHEDIPKAITLFAKPPVCQVLVEAPGGNESSQKTAGEAGEDAADQLLEDAVLKLAEKLGGIALPEMVLPQPSLPEAMAQGVVEG